MNEGLKKFRELLLTDAEFQQKLKASAEAYDGKRDEEEFFHAVLVPLGQEYGISATFEDYKSYLEGLDGAEMNNDELAQLAGGKGFGAVACFSWGLGLGGVSKGQTVCIALGIGYGESACAGPGV